MTITLVTDGYAVSPQIIAADIDALKSQGFVTIICNRPDNEEAGQPAAAEIAAACEQAGLAFHHIPVAGMPIAADAIANHRQIVDASTGPVLAYCRSGQRSTIIWKASA